MGLQVGFDKGYSEGYTWGYRLGRLRGRLAAKRLIVGEERGDVQSALDVIARELDHLEKGTSLDDIESRLLSVVAETTLSSQPVHETLGPATKDPQTIA